MITPATLAKAFRGERVPQDRNDEPARVLLERIHAQRVTTPKSLRSRDISGEYEGLPMVAEPKVVYQRRK